MSDIEVRVDEITGDVAISWPDTPEIAVVHHRLGETQVTSRSTWPTGMTTFVPEATALEVIAAAMATVPRRRDPRPADPVTKGA